MQYFFLKKTFFSINDALHLWHQPIWSEHKLSQWNHATLVSYNTLNLSYDFMGFLRGGLVAWELLGWNESNDAKKMTWSWSALR